MKFFKTILIFVAVWLVASLVNGLLSGICITVFDNDDGQFHNDVFGLTIFFSFLFSTPLVGLVWFVATIASLAGSSSHKYYQSILGTTLLASLIGAVFFIAAFKSEFHNSCYAVAVSIVLSAITTVLLFHKQFKANA